ncbi:MAG: hypothetical protein RQ966_13225 [Acetobacteraceae bacterium]|nr:hypothetical protein [Acetobacteraceae bacterium]
MSDKIPQGGGADDKHELARNLAEAALRAKADGDPDRAASLLEEAQRVDPSAAVDALAETGGVTLPQEDDTDLAVESETVVPGSDAPSRAGITGSGSGADGQGL